MIVQYKGRASKLPVIENLSGEQTRQTWAQALIQKVRLVTLEQIDCSNQIQVWSGFVADTRSSSGFQEM